MKLANFVAAAMPTYMACPKRFRHAIAMASQPIALYASHTIIVDFIAGSVIRGYAATVAKLCADHHSMTHCGLLWLAAFIREQGRNK